MFGLFRRYHNPYGDPGGLLNAIDWLRTIGTIAVVAVGVWGGGLTYVNAKFAEPMLAPFLAAPCTVLGMLVVLLAARSGHRGAALRALRVPAVTLLSVVVALGTFVFVFRQVADYVTQTENHSARWFVALGVGLLMRLFGVPALFWVLILLARRWFFAAVGHPMLPALCAFCFAAVQFCLVKHQNASVDVQTHVVSLLETSAPIALMAVAVLEIVVWRLSAGVSLRELPQVDPDR